ncbi:MAG TPA: OB-fold domain-containing protein [Chloroflexota bacterium]|nr:OB-fold domain-containing protein [Chloroflexota bacterium]
MAVEIGGGLTGYKLPSGEITIPLPGSSLDHVPEGAEPMTFAGSGTVLTYSIVYVPTTRFKDKAPYALAIVELAEGARLMAIVDGGTAENLAVDAQVRYTHRDEYGYHFALVG